LNISPSSITISAPKVDINPGSAGALVEDLGGESVDNAVTNTSNLRPKDIPDDWQTSPSGKNDGEIYKNPKNGHDLVRSMPGKESSPYPGSRAPYLKRQIDGKFYDKFGNKILGDDPGASPEANIPASEFKFIPKESINDNP
jgi:hypothetical protein